MQKTERSLILTIFIVGAIIWTAVIAGLYSWSVKNEVAQTTELSKHQARAFFQGIVTTRYWNATHGGVYVPITSKVQPNPYLEDPDRDVVTKDGLKLTKINPAFMTRQIGKIAAQKNSIWFHITSAKPIRPKNSPDTWEHVALKSFSAGSQEYSEFVDSDNGEKLFRYMAPLQTERPCLKCHAKQGYKVGDLRGGISVTFKADPILATQRQVTQHLAFAYGSIWIIGLLGIVWGWRRLSWEEKNRWEIIAIKNYNENLKRAVDQRTTELAEINVQLTKEITEHEKAKEVAETATQAKSDFLANMSHELRTPLNSIIGYSELLMEDAEDLGQEGFIPDLERINTAGTHLLELINDILDFSKIEAGKVELYLEVFSVASMIEDVTNTIRPLAVKNKNTLKVLCEDDIGSMHADMTKVRQTLFNLISNACKFTEQGTITLRVNRESVDENDWITFVVSDTGIGITEAQMGKIYQAFSQAEASTSGKYGGTGLGLAISKQFCHLMGGDIFVESKTGKGTTFTIRLPVEGVPPRAEAALPAGPQIEKVPDVAGTVLVIDDDPEVRDLMKRFLIKEGFRVVTASSGEEGLRMAKALHPEVITLDVMMPGMDGWVVLSALKSDSELIDIPVIMLTIVDQKNLGYALGAADYLTKPIDRDLLRTVLKKYRKASTSLRVLLVEDDQFTREMLRHALEKDGWAVIEAENGRIALERLAEMQPAVILLDLMMPEMDGFELVAELRKHEAWRSIPIIVITAKDLTSEDSIRLHGYVEKILPKGAYTRKELLDEIRDLVKVSVHLASASKE